MDIDLFCGPCDDIQQSQPQVHRVGQPFTVQCVKALHHPDAKGTHTSQMIECLLTKKPAGTPLQILCLGAHSDDLEIGCGGTLLTLAAGDTPLNVTWLVFSANDSREKEAHTSANAFLAGAAEKRVLVETFRDGFFPYIGGEIKEYFERLKHQVTPDVIFTHYRHDLHQDHRVISDLTWNTFRNHFILEYEIPKYDGDIGAPNAFVRLDECVCRLKVKNILDHFASQEHKQWFTEDIFRALLRLRGMECGSPSGYAEAFYVRKVVIGRP